MSGYTKGPWKLDKEDTSERGEYTPPQVFSIADIDNPKIVCTLAVRNGVTEIDNGKLIACAPEMAEMLMESRDSIGGDWRDRREALLKKAGVINDGEGGDDE